MTAASSVAPSVVIVDDDVQRTQRVRESASLAQRPVLAVRWGPQVRPLVRLLSPQLVIAGVAGDLETPRMTIRAIRGDGYADPIVVVGAASASLGEHGASACVEDVRGYALEAALEALGLAHGARASRNSGNHRRYMHYGEVVVDLDEQTIMKGGRLLRMSPTTAALFRALLDAGGATLSRAALMSAVWEDGAVSLRVIDQQVSRLRRQLETDPRRPVYLHTVFGKGYRLATA